jgi:hypothetical protein
MGRFVGFLPDEVLAACTAAIDDASLLRTAFVLEGKDRIDDVIGLMPDERLARMLGVVASEGLWVEALDLLAHLGGAQIERLARLADGADPSDFDGLREAAAEHGVEDVLDRARSHGLPIPA